jgi:hypothetical protein
MTCGYIQDLKFAVEVFDESGNLKEGARPPARPRCRACRLRRLPHQVSKQAAVPILGRADSYGGTIGNDVYLRPPSTSMTA